MEKAGVRDGLGLSHDSAVQALEQAKSLRENVILVWESEAPQIDPLEWLELESSCPAFYWKERRGQIEYAGARAALVLSGHGPGSLAETCAQAARILDQRISFPQLPHDCQPRFFGGFAFDPGRESGALWSGFDDATLIFPEALLVRASGQSRLLLSVVVHPGESVGDVLLSADNVSARHCPRGMRDFETLPSQSSPLEAGLSQTAWSEMVHAALARIKTGSLDKVVLSRQLWLRNTALSTWPVMRRLRDRMPSCFHFAFDLCEGRSFVGSTPESLFNRTNDDVETECIAGTIERGADRNSDQSLADCLLSSPKGRLEHYYVLEDTLQRLSGLCDRFDAAAIPSVLKLPTLQHLMTKARGHLKAGITTGDILASLHPTPAVGGSPRDAALSAIRELEPVSRGWYAGPVGWYARDRAEFAVAIRSALLTGNEMCVFAGAGIVQGSTPEDEWREAENKALAFLNALQ
jgi:menaquinone-specific isochorismate synthase